MTTSSRLTPVMGEADGLLLDGSRLGMVTDLYELAMAAAYWSAGLAGRRATFELFFRALPPRRSYMVAAGLEQAVHYLLHLQFSDADVRYIRGLPMFAHASAGWLEELRHLRFSGDLWAIPEGTVVFPDEPLLRVTAPLMEAQIAETYLLASLAYQTSVATKAARLVTAARGRTVVDFGTRRGHGPQAGVLAARASFIGGCSGTSNVAAAERLNITPVGTMAHAWVMAIGDEREAFEKFAAVFPDKPTFLIDTFDTLEGARNATRCSKRPGSVRLDSGDIESLSRAVRQLLDESGWHDVKIFASGDLNEDKIDALLARDAPIDAFGVGTELTTVADAPSLGCVYKLVELEGGYPRGRIKLSPGKQTLPGRKQVYRQLAADRKPQCDVIGRADEQLAGEPLLRPVLAGGRLVQPLPSLRDSQRRCMHQIERLPQAFHDLEGRARYPVHVSPMLQEEFDRLARRPL